MDAALPPHRAARNIWKARGQTAGGTASDTRSHGCPSCATTATRGSIAVTAARHAMWPVLIIGCFHPSYDHPACGPNGECPGGLRCDLQMMVCSREDGGGLP